MVPPDTFGTPRCLMRRPRLADAAGMQAAWTGDPEVVRYLPWLRHADVADAERYVASLLARWDDGTMCSWVITVLPGDSPDGIAIFRPNGDDVEIGYALARRHWGHGLMTEVGHALVDLAFRCSRAERMVAVLDAENTASVRVLERLGLRHHSTFTDDVPHPNISTIPRPCHRFALDRATWSQRRHIQAVSSTG